MLVDPRVWGIAFTLVSGEVFQKVNAACAARYGSVRVRPSTADWNPEHALNPFCHSVTTDCCSVSEPGPKRLQLMVPSS